MGFLLGDLLRRLCVEIGWSYAVFWRAVELQGRIFLVWEDGFCEQTPGDPAVSGFEAMDLLIKEKELLYGSRCQKDDRVYTLVHRRMPIQVHVLGDGLVGKAASTGNHQWILQGNLQENLSASVGPVEINDQFLAGIQTISTIPVLPHGVLQLGSTQIILDDIGFVNHVQQLFMQLGSLPISLLSDHNGNSFIPNILVSTASQPSFNKFRDVKCYVNGLPSYSFSRDKQLLKCPDSSSISKTKILPISTIAHSPCSVDKCNICANSQLKVEYLGGQVSLSDIDSRRFEHRLTQLANTEIRYKAGIFQNTSSLANGKVESTKGQSSSIIEKSQMIRSSTDHFKSFQRFVDDPSWSHCTSTGDKYLTLSSSCKQIDCDESFQVADDQMSESNGLGTDNKVHLISRPDVWLGDSNLVSENAQSSVVVPGHNSVVPASSDEVTVDLQQHNSENDLFDMLGLEPNNSFWDDSIANFSYAGSFGADIPTSITQIDAGPFGDISNNEIACSGIFSETGSDQLLDSIVSQIKPVEKVIPDDTVSCNMSTKSSRYSCHSSPAVLAGSSGPLSGKIFGPVIAKSEMAAGNSIISECSMFRSEGANYLGDEKFKSQLSQWSGKDPIIDSDRMSAANCNRVEEVGKLNRKKYTPGDNNPRPRPKDRQMIQDRFKELREIVPNGAKLSNDALLEKTISHMLFLQSVTMHADKLKETGKPKIISKDEGLLRKDNFKGGATWALEVGNQSTICPIVVEDLKTPRHMLIEMLCEKRGLFLEIADLIRGLGLTILKGVMEARDDKVWARFAVEANRDVTRMEIFLSLMHLLEPTTGNVILEGIENFRKPHNNVFNQSSLPPTRTAD